MAKKEISMYGMTPEEFKKLSVKEVLPLLPSRARRSLKRGMSEAHKVVLEKVRKNDPNIRTHERDMIIIPEMIGATIKVHTGKEWIPVLIQPEMVGHFLGEYAQTRKRVGHSAPGIGATRSSAALSVR